MSANSLFLKKDNTGKQKLTVLSYCLIGILAVGSCVISQNKKPTVKVRFKQTIIKQKYLTEAATSKSATTATSITPLSHEGNAFKFNYKQVLERTSQPLKPPSPKEAPPWTSQIRIPPINTKMIVFDNTNGYQSNWVIPLGSMVKCLLIHNIVTNNFEAPVIAQVWEDFYFDGKLLLPFGTRIYGTASVGRQRDRVIVTFHDIVFQDGKSVKINAIGLSQDGSGGLTGAVIDDGTKKTILAMAMNLLSGMALGFQQSSTNELTGIQQVESNSRNALLNGVANTFQKQAQQTQSDIENSKGYAIVLAGNEILVYFQNKADLGA